MVEDMLSGGRRGRPFHVSDGVILDNFPITRPFEERAYRCEQCARSDGGALRRLIDQGCDLAASDRRHGFLAQGGDCIDFKEAPRFRPALIILAVHRQITLRHIFKRGRSQFAPHLTLGASGILTGSYPSKLDLGQLARAWSTVSLPWGPSVTRCVLPARPPRRYCTRKIFFPAGVALQAKPLSS